MSNLQKQKLIESFFLDTILDSLQSQKIIDLSVFKGSSEIPYSNVIIGTSSSNTQMNGVINKVMDILENKEKIKVEGKNSTWLLIEVKDILIHILNKESREFYMLEDLYFDCELIYQYG